MRSVEVEGDSIDDAIAKALQELAVARDRVAIEILKDASRGLFGFGGQEGPRACDRQTPADRESMSPMTSSPPVSRETGAEVARASDGRAPGTA